MKRGYVGTRLGSEYYSYLDLLGDMNDLHTAEYGLRDFLSWVGGISYV